MKIKELKSKLKELAVAIRENKAFYKECQRGNKKWEDLWAWQRNHPVKGNWDYRHMHIAYCLLRGRTMLQIENKVKEGNEPNMTKVENYMREYRDVEAVSCGDTVVGI